MRPFIVVQKDGKVRINKKMRRECIQYRRDKRRASNAEMVPLLSSDGEISEVLGGKFVGSVIVLPAEE